MGNERILTLEMPVTNPASKPTNPRVAGLDWLRAVAAICVVILHAGIPYLTHPLPGLIWATTSPETSAAVNAVCWGINGFIMPVFFLMTGCLAGQLLRQRGAVDFLKHRLLRIGGPLLFAMVVVLPVDLYAWLLGWVDLDLIPISKLRSLKVRGELGDALWGLSHLWYLAYVLFFSFAACGLTVLRDRYLASSQATQTSPKQSEWSWPIRLGACLLALAVAAVTLSQEPRIVIGFRNAFFPLAANLFYYSVPFTLGWHWQKISSRLIRSDFVVGALTAAGLWALLWPELLHYLEQQEQAADTVVPVLFAFFGMLMSGSLFGLAMCSPAARLPAVVSYLAKASFWIYLVHHPLAALIQIDLRLLALSAELETLLVVGLTLVLCLASFEVCVRRTPLGRLLHGVQEPSLPRPLATAPATERAAA
ncbi:acyltransferase family protein [Planctomicrobium sp. SH664]|uniref:acyltransferase family protein n=1 Tax=Planctomicrobium sp. SH664 TaxID=3448125 RepID=UPI003F5C7A57